MNFLEMLAAMWQVCRRVALWISMFYIRPWVDWRSVLIVGLPGVGKKTLITLLSDATTTKYHFYTRDDVPPAEDLWMYDVVVYIIGPSSYLNAGVKQFHQLCVRCAQTRDRIILVASQWDRHTDWYHTAEQLAAIYGHARVIIVSAHNREYASLIDALSKV